MNFNELIKHNKNNVKSIIKLITKESNEDLEQEVYFKVWKNSEKYKEKGTFSSWISTIAKNVSKDYVKSAYKRNEKNSITDENTIICIKDKKDSPEKKFIKTEKQQKIINAINSLKPKLKEIIMLCEIEGYSYEESAHQLKCPVGTIKSRLYKAKKELSVLLKDLI